jgi:sugar/nucleoside kinase (ribokinase family)
VVFEPSATGDDASLFARALRAACIVKYADERLSDLSVFDLRPGAVEIQTRGAGGLRFRVLTDRPQWTHLSAYRLAAVHDTAGAGDWCTAGLLHELFSRPAAPSLMDRESLARGLAFGQVLATLNCMTEGARGLLAAWAPDRIVDAARELAAARTHAPQESLPLHEAQLRGIADDVSRSGRSSTSYDDGFYCCTAS